MSVRSVFFIVYPGFELLDLSGPLSVFSSANALVEQPVYKLETLSTDGGVVHSSAGVGVATRKLCEVKCNSTTTYLIVGSYGEYLREARKDAVLCHWLHEQSGLADRFGSVCTGAFVLEAAGLLAGKTVTTHWAGIEQLRALNKPNHVLEDALYHNDGNCWTSAGVTTGIDMALEILKRDHGQALMQMVARYLVVYSQRPGKQSQFAVIQQDAHDQEDDFARLLNWLKENIVRQIKVSEMADFMCMSERSFQRRFSALYSQSPSRYFERMRMEYARDFLLPKHSVERSARLMGYKSVAAFRTSFKKHFGMSPTIHQHLG